MRIAITGPTGAIGSELVKLALAEGHEVVAIARPHSKNLGNLPKSERLTVLESDISEYKHLTGKDFCDIFFHLAWKETFGAERDNVDIQMMNIQYALDAVRLAKSWNAKAFIGTGSQAEYGPTDMKLNASTPAFPESGYGIAKLTTGRFCGLLCKQLGIRYNWARIVSEYGEKDPDYTLIKYLINSFLDGIPPELTKCEQVWDYTYSVDDARALLAIGLHGKDGKTYVVGCGEGKTLRQYVEEIRNIVNPDVDIRFGAKEYFPHQPMYLCADITELTADTGYVPKYSFAEGMRNTVNYVKKQRMGAGQ